ncbi:hypothetical protein COOONC_20088 [Cooperia oncophora]
MRCAIDAGIDHFYQIINKSQFSTYFFHMRCVFLIILKVVQSPLCLISIFSPSLLGTRIDRIIFRLIMILFITLLHEAFLCTVLYNFYFLHFCKFPLPLDGDAE